jgi:hypothetical protein
MLIVIAIPALTKEANISNGYLTNDSSRAVVERESRAGNPCVRIARIPMKTPSVSCRMIDKIRLITA